jgi:Fe-S cluster biogenesis protein NfuA
MGSGFGGYAEAMEMRDVMRSAAERAVDDVRPMATFARVYTIDVEARTCLVVLNGDFQFTPIKVTCGSIIPAYVDQIVRLEGPPGARYVADVLGPTQTDSRITMLAGEVEWIQATLGTGFTHQAGNPVRYRLINDHGEAKVQLRGACTTTTTSTATALFTMPVGMRPLVAKSLLIPRNASGGSNAALLSVAINGAMVLDGATTGVKESSTGGTHMSGAGANTGSATVNAGHSHKFLNLEWGTTDAYRNADSSARFTTGQTAHVHAMTPHFHGLDSVIRPTFLGFEDVSYFL